MGGERVCDGEILGHVGGPWYRPWRRQCGGWKKQRGRYEVRGYLGKSGSRTSGERHGQGAEWTHHLHMTIVFPTARQGEVVGERKHKECCTVSEGGWQERHGGIVDYRRAPDEKERS